MFSCGNRRKPAYLSLALICIWTTACGGGGSGPTLPPPPPAPPPASITSVVVSPASVNVLPGQTQQFSVTVQGTGTFNPAVNWSVNGAPGSGFNLGSISSAGLYTASLNPPNPNTVTIKATSVADGNKSASATALIGTSPFHITGVTVSPTSLNVLSAETHQFTATVQGTGAFDPSVRWFVGGNLGGDGLRGTISASGLYTAPEFVMISPVVVEASSGVDTSVKGSATLNLSQGPPIIEQIIPSSAAAGQQIQIQGHAFSGFTSVFFPGVNGLVVEIPVGNTLGSPTLITMDVPLGTVSGPIYVRTRFSASGQTFTSNAVSFTRIPHVRIRADRRDLSPGETSQFQSRILGEDLGQQVTWSADAGTITASGLYTAPTQIASDTFALVTGCIANTQICQQLRLGLHPFRIEPAVAVVRGGDSIQLEGIIGQGSVSTTWLLDGPGSLTAGGAYTASGLLPDGGSALATATVGAQKQQAAISVSGAFPGIINRVSDYFDLNQYPFPFGTSALHVAVGGSRAYVLASGSLMGPLDQSKYWIDVYDLTDPVRPVWIDAVESLASGDLLTCGQFLYVLASSDFTAGFNPILAAYDIRGTRPVPVARAIETSVNSFLNAGCRAVTPPSGIVSADSPAMVDIADLSSGTQVHMPYLLPAPQPSVTWQVVSAATNGQRLFAFVDVSNAGNTKSHLVAYDLTVVPPSLLGDLAVPASEFKPRIAGNYLIAVPPVRQGLDESDVYDVAGTVPVFAGRIPAGAFLDGGPERAVFADTQIGMRILDVSGRGSPELISSVFVEVSVQQDAAVFGKLILSAEIAGGLAIYDASTRGGPVRQSVFGTNHFLEGAALDQLVTPQTLYVAAGLINRGGLLVYDLQTQPATFAGSFDTGNSPAQALAILNSTMYLGTVDDIRILNVSNPGNPAQVGSLAVGTAALTVSGSSLFVGTVANRLVVFDISNPVTPVQLSSIPLPDLPIQMRSDGNRLFIADSTAGLLIFDVTNPAAPLLVSQTQPSTNVVGVALDGNLALLAAWEEGIVIVDFTNPALPTIMGRSRLETINPYSALGSPLLNRGSTIALQDQIAFIGVFNADPASPPNNGNGMIYGFDYRQPSKPRLVSLSANGIVSSAILTLASSGSSLFGGGGIIFTQWDSTQARNTINLFLLPDALRPPVTLHPPTMTSAALRSYAASQSSTHDSQHAKGLRFVRRETN